MEKKIKENTDFKKELSKNFCAAKYYHQLPKFTQICISEKAENMNENQLKDFIKYLGSIT